MLPWSLFSILFLFTISKTFVPYVIRISQTMAPSRSYLLSSRCTFSLLQYSNWKLTLSTFSPYFAWCPVRNLGLSFTLNLHYFYEEWVNNFCGFSYLNCILNPFSNLYPHFFALYLLVTWLLSYFNSLIIGPSTTHVALLNPNSILLQDKYF